jgi:hypothetical protein
MEISGAAHICISSISMLIDVACSIRNYIWLSWFIVITVKWILLIVPVQFAIFHYLRLLLTATPFVTSCITFNYWVYCLLFSDVNAPLQFSICRTDPCYNTNNKVSYVLMSKAGSILSLNLQRFVNFVSFCGQFALQLPPSIGRQFFLLIPDSLCSITFIG